MLYLLSKSLPRREVPPSDPPLQLLIEEVGEGRLPTPDQAIGVLPNPYDNCSPGQPRARPCMEAVTASLSFLSSPTHTHTLHLAGGSDNAQCHRQASVTSWSAWAARTKHH